MKRIPRAVYRKSVRSANPPLASMVFRSRSARLLDLLAPGFGGNLAGRFQLLQFVVSLCQPAFQQNHSEIVLLEESIRGGVRRIDTFAPYCRAQARTAASVSAAGQSPYLPRASCP